MNDFKKHLEILWIDIKLMAINIAIEVIEAIIPLYRKLMKYKEGIEKQNSTSDD